jgi:hypothetical protein
LWAKLSALEKKCFVRLESFLDKGGGGLRWRILIQSKDGETIVVERPEVKDAVNDAVTQAEKAGLCSK